MMGARRGEILGVLTLAALTLVTVLVILPSQGTYPLDRSAMGHQGLVSWMRGQGADIRYAGQGTVTRDAVGLRILPVMDTELNKDFTRPEDDIDYLMTGTERDLTHYLVTEKAARLPSLVVAPKWTRAVRYSGYAHASLLIDVEAASSGVSLFRPHDGPLLRPGGVLEFAGPKDLTGILYEPQLFPADLHRRCVPMLSAGRGHLLIRCERRQGTIWLLSDPDFLNNHGLRLGDNAQIATAVLKQIAEDKAILVDTTTHLFTLERPPPPPSRTWADLLRFFAWPLALAWAGLAALLALVLWRAWARFGPPRSIFDDRIGASRTVSIAAKARLLRMAGNDPLLFRAHVENRLRQIEHQLFGRMGGDSPMRRIEAFVSRRNPAAAAGFAAAAEAAMSAPAGPGGPAEMEHLLDAFEREAERVLHEPG